MAYDPDAEDAKHKETNAMKIDILQKDRKFLIFFAVLILSFFLIKTLSPVLIENLYEQNAIDLLNVITKSDTVKSLGYYLGRIENLISGPLCMLLSGIAFLLYCFRYLRDSNVKVFGIAVFVYFLLSKYDILFYPPYGDTIGGPFAEAMWLAKNNFDYIGLSKQPLFLAGGPKVYLFSIYPSYIAALMRIIPNIKLFLLLNHLIVFAFSAAIVSLFRKVLLKTYSKEAALLLSMVLLAIPLFQSQVEQINMEIPMLFFSMLSCYYLIEKKIGRAVMFGILAAMVKGVAILICGAVFVVGVFLFIAEKDKSFRIRVACFSILSVLYVVLQYYANFYILNDAGKVSMVGHFAGWSQLKKAFTPYFYVFSFLFFAWKFIAVKIRKRSESLLLFLKANYETFVFFMLTGAWYGLFLNSQGLQHRYWLLMTPFILPCFYFVIQSLIKNGSFLRKMLVAVIVFLFICSYGLLFEPDLYDVHSAQERTLEYRNDLKLHIKLMKEIEEKYSNFTIGAPFPYAQMLAFPEFGYVSKDLDVIIYQFPCQYGIKNLRNPKDLDIKNTLWVGLKTKMREPIASMIDYPVNSQDIVIQEINVGNRQAKLFLGGRSIIQAHIMIHTILKNYKHRIDTQTINLDI